MESARLPVAWFLRHRCLFPDVTYRNAHAPLHLKEFSFLRLVYCSVEFDCIGFGPQFCLVKHALYNELNVFHPEVLSKVVLGYYM